MYNKLLLLCFTIAIAFGLIFSGCEWFVGKDDDRKLIIAVDDQPDTLNPIFEQNPTGVALIDPLFDGLFNRTGERIGEYENGLALDIIQDEKDHRKKWNRDGIQNPRYTVG